MSKSTKSALARFDDYIDTLFLRYYFKNYGTQDKGKVKEEILPKETMCCSF